jgi:myo-inositol-1(or 4)-monophosphatase
MIDFDELMSVADAALDRVVPRLADPEMRSNISVSTKSSATDMVTEMDEWSETTIVETIAALRPGDGFLGEEGASRPSETGVVWVIDPIDGTTNFLYDIPGFSISIAARVDGVDVVGVVHDPIRDERFRAVHGGGATCNDAPIHASAKSDLATALIATGFSYEADRRRAQAQALTILLPLVRDIRRFGGAALDLCSVACGRVDGYYERGLGTWDSAAGAVIATEAGAIVEDRQPHGGALVAAAPGIVAEFIALVDDSGANSA